MNNGERVLTKFRKQLRAISLILAVLMMIVIAVAGSLVTYSWVKGYLSFTTAKTGRAIQIHFIANRGDDLVIYVQNVGKGIVELDPAWTAIVYVNGALSPCSDVNPADGLLGEGQTAILVVEDAAGGPGERVRIKVITQDGIVMEASAYPETGEIIRSPMWHYVNIMSNVDGLPDKGAHSNFADQRIGPDSIFDVLTEEDTATSTSTVNLINQESFEDSWPPSLPASWSKTGRWNREENREYHGSYSADFDGSRSGASGNLVTCDLDCSDAVSISVAFRFYDERLDSNELLLDYFNGSAWINIADLGGGSGLNWDLYEQQISDPSYFTSNFKIRWRANDVKGRPSNQHAYVDFVTVTKEVPNTKYEADLEIQFTDIDLSREYSEICIKTGLISSENLEVYIWTGSTWELLLSPLVSNQWHNVTQSITSNTLTLRFLDSLESNDPVQNTWEIDCAVLYAPL